MYNSPYKSCMDCIAKVYQVEGFRAFYRSYTTQLTMNIPFQSIHFMIYEFMQTVTNKERRYNPPAHMVSGAIAGAVAAAITTPLDVCKTLLNTTPEHTQGSGLFNAIRSVYKLGGISGYFRGMQARVLYQMPSTAICWSMYELFKYLLIKTPTEKDVSVRLIVPTASQDVALIESKGRKYEERPSGPPEPEPWGSFGPVKARELPSVSGAGLYGALSLNTVHNADSSLQKGTTLLDITHS